MRTTIVTSLILCVVEFLTIILASPMAKPDLVLHFLPKDIRETAKDHPEPPKRKQMAAHILLGVFLLVFLGGMLFLGIDGLKRGYGFGKLTLRFINALYDEGFARVQLIDTTNGIFMTKGEAALLMLNGSSLLIGEK